MMIMSFNDFSHKNSLKKKATPNIKNQNILSSMALSKVRICLRFGPFSNDLGIVK